MAFLIALATAMVAKAQTERKMTVDELFQLVESNSKTLRQEKISVEFAKKGIEAARSARLPELTASASVSMNGDVVMMDRDFTNAHGFAAPRWGNSLALEAQQVVYAVELSMLVLHWLHFSISRLRLVNNSAASNSSSWLWGNIWKSSNSKTMSR